MKRETRDEGGRRRGLFVRSVLVRRRHSCIRGPPKHLTDPCRPHRKRHRDAPAGRPDRCKVIKYLAGPGVFFPRCHTLFSFGYSRDHVGRTSSRASRGRRRRPLRAGGVRSVLGRRHELGRHRARRAGLPNTQPAHKLSTGPGGAPLARICPLSFTFRFHPHAGFAVHDRGAPQMTQIGAARAGSRRPRKDQLIPQGFQRVRWMRHQRRWRHRDLSRQGDRDVAWTHVWPRMGPSEGKRMTLSFLPNQATTAPPQGHHKRCPRAHD